MAKAGIRYFLNQVSGRSAQFLPSKLKMVTCEDLTPGYYFVVSRLKAHFRLVVEDIRM